MNMCYICKKFKILSKSVDKFLISFYSLFIALLEWKNEAMPSLIFEHLTVFFKAWIDLIHILMTHWVISAFCITK